MASVKSSEHKIFLERSDSVEAAAQAVIAAAAPRVVVNIPKGSPFAVSALPFYTLQREARTAGKELEVESVDDRVLEFASRAGIKASNPILRTRDRAVSDIVIRNRPPRRVTPTTVPPAPPPEPPAYKTAGARRARAAVPVRESAVPHSSPPPSPTAATFQELPPKRSYRPFFIGGGVVAALGLLWWLLTYVFSSAAVTVTLKKTEVPFDVVVEVSDDATKVATTTAGSIIVPGILLNDRRNLELEFPATAREKIETRAGGRLSVSNRFSSTPQVLVANTRFESPGGKIFRLNQRTTIPGATIVGGQIAPSTIEVAVTADAPGVEYNVGAGAGWHIPGFSGTPKYDAFVVEAKTPLSGGFVGERIVPSAEDTASARTQIETALKDALESQMLVVRTESYQLLPGATSFVLVRQEITPGASSLGTFRMFAEAEMRQLLFNEQMLREALAARAGRGTEFAVPTVHDLFLTYGNARVDLVRGEMSFPLSGVAVFKEGVDDGRVKREILGKNRNEIQYVVNRIPGVSRIDVVLRPLWVKWLRRVPRDLDRVTVEFE